MFENKKKKILRPSVSAQSSGIPVEIEKSCWKDMFGWCRAANSEVSGHGLVKLENGIFKVYRVFFPQQRCSSGYTEIGEEALGRLDNSINRRWMEQNGIKDIMGTIGREDELPSQFRRFWWHTHFTFNTFWSGTDDFEAQRIAHSNGEYSLSLVINQAGDFLARADFVSPIDITIDKLDIRISDDTSIHPKRNYKSDIKRWVSPIPVTQRKFRASKAIWGYDSKIDMVKDRAEKTLWGSEKCTCEGIQITCEFCTAEMRKLGVYGYS